MQLSHQDITVQYSESVSGNELTSSSDTSFLLSNTLTLLRRNTHPGLTSGCATYTLNLQRHAEQCSISVEYLAVRWETEAVQQLRSCGKHNFQAAASLTSWQPESSHLRAERHKDTLIKYHAAVSACHTDFRVGCLPVNDFCGSHI